MKMWRVKAHRTSFNPVTKFIKREELPVFYLDPPGASLAESLTDSQTARHLVEKILGGGDVEFSIKPMNKRTLLLLGVLLSAGCAFKSPQTTYRWPDDPVAGVRVYKPGTSGYADSLIKWSNHYAKKMELQQPELIFQQLPNKWCGLALPPPRPQQVLIAYDLSKWCEFSWNARDVALHETCHFRLAHTYGTRSEQLDAKQKHKEVDECMEAYR